MAKRKNKNRKNAKRTNNNQNSKQDKLNTSIFNELEKKTQTLKSNIDLTKEELKIQPENVETITDKQLYTKTRDLYNELSQVYKVVKKRSAFIEKEKEKYETLLHDLESNKKEVLAQKDELNSLIKRYDSELKEINLLRANGSISNTIDKKILDNFENNLKELEKSLSDKLSEVTQKHSQYIQLLKDNELYKNKLKKDYNENLIKEKEKIYEEFSTKYSEKENKLRQLKNEIDEKENELANELKKLNWEKIDFGEEKQHLIEKARKKEQEERKGLYRKITVLESVNNDLLMKIEQYETDFRNLGNRKVEDIIASLREKERIIEKLNEKLELNPDNLKIDELKRLKKEKYEWEEEKQKLIANLNEYKNKYEKQKLQVGEKETLEFQNEQLNERLKLQKTALMELKEEVGHFTEESKNKTTFINCSEMDKSVKKSHRPPMNTISDKWIQDLQQAILQVEDDKLYYDLDTIRSFIAGLSMTQLSILQGISGTGKTSLPRAVSKAIGGEFGIVEVQSGWKDRQDLIGYYNTFEKKFYEQEFLKYLYKAGTPQYKNMPFFIILDEMNLSHPEHYFADILSIMEKTDRSEQIIPIGDKMPDTPKLMQELKSGGIGLKIPKNVWFIGTANHDETTVQFAPKTQDRANIMEMPKNYVKFDSKNIDFESVKVSYKELNEFFLRSISKHKKVDFATYINSEGFKTASHELNIGWGNRLEKQINHFVPVFKELGGSESDAIDQIIYSKIISKIKGRYGLLKDNLEQLKTELENNFTKMYNDEIPIKSIDLLEKEIKRIG